MLPTLAVCLYVVGIFSPLLIAVVCMLCRYFVYVAYVHDVGAGAHDSGWTPTGGEVELARPEKMGMTEAKIMSLPEISFDRSALASASPAIDVCPICFGEFEDGEAVRVLPQCGHGFHRACIDVWLRKNASCPSCRRLVDQAKREAEPTRIIVVVSRE